MNPQQADTLVKNIDEGVKLILFVIRKRLGHCASYPLVLNAQHALAADAIIEASKTSTITMELVHSLVYGLFSEEVVSHEDLALNHPIERFLPLFARHHSGDGWRPLPDFSSALARLEWDARTAVVYDACLHGPEYSNGRNGYVFRFDLGCYKILTDPLKCRQGPPSPYSR